MTSLNECLNSNFLQFLSTRLVLLSKPRIGIKGNICCLFTESKKRECFDKCGTQVGFAETSDCYYHGYPIAIQSERSLPKKSLQVNVDLHF